MPLYGPNFLLTSTIYPVEVEEEAGIFYRPFSAFGWEVEYGEAAITYLPFAGAHTQTQFPTAYSLEEAAAIAPPVSFSGAHVQTYFLRAHDAGIESAAILTPTFSGSHIQTYFPFAYALEELAAVTPPTPFTGTLA